MDIEAVSGGFADGRAGEARTSSKRHRERCLSEPQG
jgi:hypothetical protein